MRKWNMVWLMLALLLVPGTAGAQDMPELFSAVKSGAVEGLASGMKQAMAAMEQELTLEIAAQSTRIEEGKTVTLTVAAGNPRPVDTPVTLALKLPQRLNAAPDTLWQAVLPAAQADPQTGELVPSVSTFTREIVLVPGGESETVQIECELNMGTRFYRSAAQMELCVSDVSASAAVQGAEDGRLYPGDGFSYDIEISNAGAAPKDVPVELVMPKGAALSGELPSGFSEEGGVIRGMVRAQAAAGHPAVPSRCVISVQAAVDEDALKDDEDAMRLLSGTLQIDGERVPLPRLQVCGARISAKLLADTDTLKAGEQAQLRLVVVNAGLAPADVRLSCVLPKGLRLEEDETVRRKENEETVKGAADLPPDDGTGAAETVAGTEQNHVNRIQEENRTLVYDVHMPSGTQTQDGMEAATQIIRLNVAAEQDQKNLGDRLVGTALAWQVDNGETRLGEAVAMRLSKPAFMGISKGDWNALFWACVLLTATVACLYAAAKGDRKEEDFCCD